MKVGIPGTVIDGVFGVPINYMEFAYNFGTPYILSPGEYAKMDIYLLPGGADVNVNRYDFPSYFAGNPNIFLEKFDVDVLPSIFGKVPILGICRGLQTAAVHCGYRLVQHLPHHPRSMSEGDLVHDVFSSGDKKPLMRTNSFHHQSVYSGSGQKLIPALWAADGTVEAMKGNLFLGVQWHPERMFENDSYTVKEFKKICSL